ncbi:hypothetical protein ACFORJ_06970 [Corynebacterium hansenii]|uniref:HTH cro/C1-type domain-containing protein n=1 Tax=Corynebacterium hansenii TaxID=394964 RepID=A0ABV7ZP18_9CORY|nr:helix-turn-helix transcriptional regulator [Corynebacterium hansenii]
MATTGDGNSGSTRGSQAAREWAQARAADFGHAVAAMRNRIGLSAVELSNRTREIGYPITRSAIAKIESNSRNGKFDVAEVVTLAAALEVSPAHLMFPGYPEGKISVVPRDEMTADEAWDWLVNGPGFNQWGALHRPRVIVTRELFEAVRDYREAVEAVEQEYRPRAFGEEEWIISVPKHSITKGREVSGVARRAVDDRYQQLRDLRAAVQRLGGDVELPKWVGTYLVLPF